MSQPGQQYYGQPPLQQGGGTPYQSYGPPSGSSPHPPPGQPGYPPPQQGGPAYWQQHNTAAYSQQPSIGSPGPPGQPPYQQQPYGYSGTSEGQYHSQYSGGPPPPQGQYQNQQQLAELPAQVPQYSSGLPAPGQALYGSPPPQGQQTPYQNQSQLHAPPPPQQGGPAYWQQQHTAAYSQQPSIGSPPPPGQPPYQQYGARPPNWQQQHQQPMPGYGAPPTPASLGYDVRQKETYGYPVNVESDAVAIRKAMKGMGCDEAVLVKVLTQPKYSNPWVMQQLIANYNERFVRDLVKDIESETRGDLETALMALVRGPLAADVHLLSKALDRAGTDEDALMNVLLCRSNADIAAIIAEYKRIKGRDLLTEIKDDVDDTLFRLYSMVLSATKAEDSVPPSPPDTDLKVTELHRATEGVIGANAVMVAQIFTSSNSAQIRDISYAYQRKYHRSLRDVIEKEFRGDMEDALLYMLEVGEDQGRADASRLGEPLRKTIRKDSLLINRVLRLFYAPLEVDPRDGVPRPLRLERAKAAYKLKYKVSLKSDIKAFLKGDYEDLILALLREM